MTVCTREDIENIVKKLPENISIEDVMEKLYLFSKIEKGTQQADKGDVIPHEEVEERLGKWLD